MASKKQKSKIAAASALTAVVVCCINMAGALVAYNLLLPKDRGVQQAPLISNEAAPVAALPTPDAPQPAAAGPTPSSGVVSSQPLRLPDEPLKVGQTPRPTAVVTDSSGRQVYRWCSGFNPDLEDGVCQAIMSLAANLTESNPHLGKKARESLSLLPRDASFVMDEGSWLASSPNAGSMMVTARTKDYGDVRLKIFMEKQNNIWVLSDGQLA